MCAAIQLLPGLEGTGRLFRWLVPALEPELRASVVRYPPDRPLSASELARFVLESAPPEPYVLLGESYSGLVAAIVAAQRPPHLRGLIFSTSFVAPPLPSWLARGPLRALARRSPPPAALVRLLMLERGSPQDMVEEVRDAMREASPDVLAARLHEVLTADHGQALRTCAVPVLYLGATHDRLVGLRGWKTVRRVRPDAASITLDGPHLLLQARAAEAAAVIVEQVRRWVRAGQG